MEVDPVVFLSSFRSEFGELVRCLVSRKTTVGWYPLRDQATAKVEPGQNPVQPITGANRPAGKKT